MAATTRVARRGEAASHQRIERTRERGSPTLPIDIRTPRVGMQLTLVPPAAVSGGLLLAFPPSLIALCALSFLSGFLVLQIRRRVRSESEARRESDRRWAVLVAVSAASREMTGTDIDPGEVLASVIGAVSGLGFERTTIYVGDGGRFRKVDAPPSDRPVPALITRVVEEATVIRFDASTQIAQDLPAVGVAVPIFVGDGVVAVLVAGSAHGHRPTYEDVDVFRMLAAQASLALAKVGRFEEQRQLIERLEGLDRMKRDWLSTVSHELRTPLTVISGMGSMLEDQWATLDEDTRVDFLGRINANAATLDRVIAQLLDFSRLDAGQLRPEAAQTDLSSLLTTVVDRLGPLFGEHDVEVDVEPGLCTLADPGLVERIIENLLSNAAKYTPPGTRVAVGAHLDDGDVVVSISDEGPGIPANELARIGERFFRGGDVMTRTTRGTGLGLAVVSEILQQHGSHLDVQSEVGIGSVFSFRLSATPDGAPARVLALGALPRDEPTVAAAEA